jgi:hypothetical protein
MAREDRYTPGVLGYVDLGIEHQFATAPIRPNPMQRDVLKHGGVNTQLRSNTLERADILFQQSEDVLMSPSDWWR